MSATSAAHAYILDIPVTWFSIPSRAEYLDAKVRSWNRSAECDAASCGRTRDAVQSETVEQPHVPPAQGAFRQLSLVSRWRCFRGLVVSEMKWHGLLDSQPRWSAAYDNSRTCAGMCVFRSRTLSFSRHLIARASAEEMRDTVLHEIAHALAGPRHGHNSKWREIALRIGCNGVRCHDIQLAPPRWIYRCSAGCWMVPRFKRSKLSTQRTCSRCHTACVYVAAV
jgi:predicted SprT family Zn-dependent metalloprotease